MTSSPAASNLRCFGGFLWQFQEVLWYLCMHVCTLYYENTPNSLYTIYVNIYIIRYIRSGITMSKSKMRDVQYVYVTIILYNV